MKQQILLALPLLGAVVARPTSMRKREVPQEHAHQDIIDTVDQLIGQNNPDNVGSGIFGLLGAAAAADGAGDIADADCLQQAIADQAFTNAKAAGDVDGMTAALLYRALERNSGSVGLPSVPCQSIQAVNPEIAALQQHQDPAATGAQDLNKEIAGELVRQIDSIGGDITQANEASTFAPGEIGDPTAAGNTCDDANDANGCINTENLRVDDLSDNEIQAAVTAQGGINGVAQDASGSGDASAAAASNGTAANDNQAAANASDANANDANADDANANDANANANDANADDANANDANANANDANADDAKAGKAGKAKADAGNAAADAAANAGNAKAGAADAAAAGNANAGAADAAAAGNANAGAADAAGAAGAADFGACDASITFGAAPDRAGDAFFPTDSANFNHGSALNINVISDFICGQLADKCNANAAAVSACDAGQAAADGLKAQAAADAFNQAIGA